MAKARQRKSAEETRKLMVEAGLAQLQSRGIGLGLDHITLESCRLEVDVPRSSSHSAWAIDDDYTPQDAFRREIIRAWLLDHEDSLFADAASEAVAELFTDPQNPPTSSAVIRTSIEAAFRAGLSLDSEEGRHGADYLSTDLAVRHALNSRPVGDRDDDALEWLRTGDRANRLSRVEDSYRPIGELLGIAPRPEFGELAFELLALVVAALVEGIALRTRLFPELGLDKPLYPTPAGDPAATLIGLSVEAMIPVFFEPVAQEDDGDTLA